MRQNLLSLRVCQIGCKFVELGHAETARIPVRPFAHFERGVLWTVDRSIGTGPVSSHGPDGYTIERPHSSTG